MYVQSVAQNFFVSCTAGAKKSHLPDLNKLCLLRTRNMFFDAVI